MAYLHIERLSKHFHRLAALRHVDLEADPGEVHAIVGANGAGKSTLMNILGGALAPSSGRIVLDGEPIETFTPRHAQRLGISVVYQEFSLVPELSVARNILLGREPVRRSGLIDQRRLLERTAALLKRYQLTIDAEAVAGQLSVADQQLVELARALSIDARLLILDEPSAVLSLSEQHNLFRIISALRREGRLILYVSHRLEEVFRIADRVTVLRDGERVACAPVAALSETELVRLMIGRRLQSTPKTAPVGAQAPVALEIEYRNAAGVSRLALRQGEIIGLAGFVGAGRSYFGRALAGLGKRGEIALRWNGQRQSPRSPRAAIRAGIIYLTEDRKRDGLFAHLSVLHNTTAAALARLSRWGWIDRAAERRQGAAMLRQLQLVARSLTMPVQELSGGNQQKVLFARALLRRPRVLICDEPTRGIDVGARESIYRLLAELARQGLAIIVISSDNQELLVITQRILVMRNRRLITELMTAQTSEEQILLAAATSRPSLAQE